MADLLQRLKQRKLVQWAIAYVAFAFALIQVLDAVSDSYSWPHLVMHVAFSVLALGFVVMLVLAWYHGERGAQRISGPELLLIALTLAIGGGLIWHFARAPAESAAGNHVATTPRNSASAHPVAATRTARPTVAPATAMSTAALASSPVAAQPIPAKSVAVLPFENLSTDKGNAYFADGMQDLILTKLADIGDLKVISRTSTMKYASHPDDVKTIAQQLDVATILEGSVQKAGNRVLINVQLIDARSDDHLWAQSYTRRLKDVFSVEGEVAEQIATALKARLSAAETARLATALSNNPAANDLFLRAEHINNYSNRSADPAAWKKAISLYRQAIAKVPNFALARARLSTLESNLVWTGQAGTETQRLNADARIQAERALELAPDLADAHLAMGFNDYWGHYHYAAALDSFAAALKLRPNDADALAARGFVFKHQGKFDAASASLQQAFAQNPRSSGLATELGLSYMVVGRYAEAKTALQQAMMLDPRNIQAKFLYSQSILFSSGDLAGAMAAAQGASPFLQSWRISLLVYQRKFLAALKLLEAVPGSIDDNAQRQAYVYRLMGEAGKARPLFAKGLSAAQAQLKSATEDPINQSLALVEVASAEIGLGHTAAALAVLAQSQAQMARVDDHVAVPWVMVLSARDYAAADRADLAVPLLTKAIASPGIGSHYSPLLLWLDPAWDPIRKDPRFQALLKQYSDTKPVTAASAAAHD